MNTISKTQLSKAVLAAALAFSADTASAFIQNVQNSGTNEAYLSVYDPNQGITFALDLGNTFNTLNALKANSNPGLSFNLTALGGDVGTNWNTFKSGITIPGQVKYLVAVGNQGADVSITGNSPFNTTGRSYANGDTVGLVSTYIGFHSDEIDHELEDQPGDNNVINASTLILDSAPRGTGQHNTDPLNTYALSPPLSAVGLWYSWYQNNQQGDPAGTPFDPNGIYGSAVGFQWGHDTGTANQFGTYAATWTLAGDTLTFGTPAAVPLPAAVWMFGAGLIGLLRLNRRKGLEL